MFLVYGMRLIAVLANGMVAAVTLRKVLRSQSSALAALPRRLVLVELLRRNLSRAGKEILFLGEELTSI